MILSYLEFLERKVNISLSLLQVSQKLNCNKNRFYSNELDINNIRINLKFYDFKSPSMSDSDLQGGFPDNQDMKMHFRNYQNVLTVRWVAC